MVSGVSEEKEPNGKKKARYLIGGRHSCDVVRKGRITGKKKETFSGPPVASH